MVYLFWFIVVCVISGVMFYKNVIGIVIEFEIIIRFVE